MYFVCIVPHFPVLSLSLSSSYPYLALSLLTCPAVVYPVLYCTVLSSIALPCPVLPDPAWSNSVLPKRASALPL